MADKFNAEDFGVFVLCGLVAVPLCDAAWTGIVSDGFTFRAVMALVVGVPLGLIGASFHWWKGCLSTARAWISKQADRWWPMAALGAAVYLLGPMVYSRAVNSINQPRPIGDVVWNFDAAANGAGFFLGMFKTANSQDIRVIGFQAHGRNTSSDPIQTFSGEIRSDLTNVTKPVYILGQDDKSSPIAACLPRIPTTYDETYGVPGLADFDVTTFEKASYNTNDGVPAATFLHDFAPFTLTLKYNGATAKRRFTTKEIEKQFDLFSKITSMQSIPRVIRKETASPPIFSRLEPLLKVTPLPHLQLLMSPDATPTGSLPKGN